jgi:hypothetical protein
MASTKIKTFFNVDWVDHNINPQWSSWLRSVDQKPHMAQCILCNKTINLSNMGRQAIVSHQDSVKHKKNINASKSSQLIKNLFKNKETVLESEKKKNAEVESTLTHQTVRTDYKSNSSIANFVTRESTLQAEIIWAMKLVTSLSSKYAFKDVSKIFQRMFPDSNIAKTVTLSNSKMAYLISFGLAPYFKQTLMSELSDTKYAICFDEALNRISQRCQMDLVVRYWSKTSNQVCTRYLNSIFFGHSTANDLVKNFYEGIGQLDKTKLLQISMDGPNVNLKFLRSIQEDLNGEEDCHLLDLGTCGLHVVHGSFQTGHKSTKWDLNNIFRAMYQLFKNSPARRADFIDITGSNEFPLKFCQVRWLENISVAQRAIQAIPNIKKYVTNTTLPKTASVELIQKVCNDKLIFAKIAFFISVATILYPFLKRFQSSNPLGPFLYDAVYDLVSQLMKRLIKKDIIKAASTPAKLLKINVADEKTWSHVMNVDIGVSARVYLSKSGVSEQHNRQFRVECQHFLKNTIYKILEKSPLKFPIVRCISCLNPKLICSNTVLSEKRMDKLLEILHTTKNVTSVVADSAKVQYSTLCLYSENNWKDNFSSFDQNSTRLDIFYANLFHEDEAFKDLWKVIKIVLILSHGNASVESGFSINKQILVTNLLEKSLVASRLVYDSINANGGEGAVEITKELINNVKMARSRYHQSLDENKNENKEKKGIGEKRKAQNQIKKLEQKKQKISHELSLETKNIDLQIAELSKYIR